jgi:hypothetical protein
MAENATVKLNIDLGTLKKTLSDAFASIKKISALKPNVKVGVDSTEVDNAKDKVAGLSGEQTVKIDVDLGEADKAAQSLTEKFTIMRGAIAAAIGTVAVEAVKEVGHGLVEGAVAADQFADSLEVAFTKQGVADVAAEIERVSESTLKLANNLGLPTERTRELAVAVASLGGFTGQSADDLTKLSAGIEVFTNGAVKGEAVAKAFSRGINDPEAVAAIDALSKKYPQLAETLSSNLAPTEKLAAANEQLKTSFSAVAAQQKGLDGILNTVQNQYNEVLEKVGTAIAGALAPLYEQLAPLTEKLMPLIEDVLSTLTPVINQIATVAADLVKQLMGPLMNLITNVIGPLAGMIAKLIPPILLVVQSALNPMVDVIEILVETLVQLIPAIMPLIDVIVQLLPVIANLVGQLLEGLVPVIKSAAKLLITLVEAITKNKVIMAALELVLNIVVYALDKLIGVVTFLASALSGIIDVISVVIDYITNLINAIASFDLDAIKNALLGLDDASAKTTDNIKKQTEETDKANAATGKLTDSTKKAAKAKNEDADAAKKEAEALARVREAIASLTLEQQKQRELTAANLLADDEARAKARVAIEEKYAVIGLENDRKALTSKGKLRAAEEELINKKIEVLKEFNVQRIADIEAKARAAQVKAEEEQQKRITDITNKFAVQKLERLKAQLAAGNTSIANELILAQRSIIENNLAAGIDAIIAQTPQYVEGIKALNAKLAQGLDPAEYKKQAALLRQTIFAELQAAQGDTSNIYAQQIKAAYQSAGDEIGKGTADVVQLIRKEQIKQAGEIFADSLRGIGEALRSVDFAAIYGDAAKNAAQLNKEQEQLIENLQEGKSTYQESVDELARIAGAQEGQASAFATAIAASFNAIAEQQIKAAQNGITAVNQALERRRQIALEEVKLEQLKADQIKQLQDQGLQNKEEYEAALAAIELKYQQQKTALKKEDEKLAQESAEVQSAALDQLAVSAGAAFASLVAGGESAGEALKKVVGSTVSALLDLYTPSIVALFSSVIPPPFGQIAGLAAVQALKALLQSALSGFEEGGYTGNGGTKQVAGVVHGQEFVMTAETTRKNRALLEHLHSGKSLESFPALQKMLADNQISTIPVTELQLMRSELSAIRQRLDSMPNGIQGNMGVDVQVGMDTYLYERDRSRMIARKLRG